jgi:hypothetical protein
VSDTARPGPQQVGSLAMTTATGTAAAAAAAARNHAWNSQAGAWSSSSFAEDTAANTVGSKNMALTRTRNALYSALWNEPPT